MGQQIIITCDNCGAIKKEANHWWAIGYYQDQFRIEPFNHMAEVSAQYKVVCGQTCAAKLLSEFMNQAVKS